jgi:hypothetical protein
MYDTDVLSDVALPPNPTALLLLLPLVAAEDWSTFPRCKLGHPSTDSTGAPTVNESEGVFTDASKAAVSKGHFV